MENIQSYSVSIRNDFRRVRAHCGNAEGPEGTSVKKGSSGNRTPYRSFHLNKETTAYKNPNSGSVVKRSFQCKQIPDSGVRRPFLRRARDKVWGAFYSSHTLRQVQFELVLGESGLT